MKALVLVCLALFATVAMADTVGLTAIGNGVVTGSWQQAFIGDVGSYNQFQILMNPGSSWEAPGANGFSAAGWSTTSFSPTNLVVQGPTTSNMTFNLNFITDMGTPLSFYFFAYNNGTVVDSALASWNGSSWSFTAPDVPAPSPVPEPASLALLGTGVAGVGMRLRKRFSFGHNS